MTHDDTERFAQLQRARIEQLARQDADIRARIRELQAARRAVHNERRRVQAGDLTERLRRVPIQAPALTSKPDAQARAAANAYLARVGVPATLLQPSQE